jgi:hypothetical protein
VRDERQAVPAYVALERDAVRIGAAARSDVLDRWHRRPPVGFDGAGPKAAAVLLSVGTSPRNDPPNARFNRRDPFGAEVPALEVGYA